MQLSRGKKTITETKAGLAAHFPRSRLRNPDTFTCTLLCMQVMVGVIAGSLFRLVCVAGGVGFEWPGDSWDVGQVGRRTSQRRRPTLQEELPVVDDSGTCRRWQQREPKLLITNILQCQTNDSIVAGNFK